MTGSFAIVGEAIRMPSQVTARFIPPWQRTAGRLPRKCCQPCSASVCSASTRALITAARQGRLPHPQAMAQFGPALGCRPCLVKSANVTQSVILE